MVIKAKTTRLIRNLALPLFIGAIAGFLTRGGVETFTATAVKPFFMPPNWLFPVAWTILYILMGYSAYLYDVNFSIEKRMGAIVYYAQLFFNFVWSFIFFNAGNYLFALIWIIILWALIIANIIIFHKRNTASGYLLLPYLFWVVFATVLNFAVFLLNK